MHLSCYKRLAFSKHKIVFKPSLTKGHFATDKCSNLRLWFEISLRGLCAFLLFKCFETRFVLRDSWSSPLETNYHVHFKLQIIRRLPNKSHVKEQQRTGSSCSSSRGIGAPTFGRIYQNPKEIRLK